MSAVSMFPPCFHGVTVRHSPSASEGHADDADHKGRQRYVEESQAPSVTGMIRVTALGTWAKRARRRITAEKPEPARVKPRIFTSSRSPGSAPATKTGPVAGLTLERSMPAAS